MSKISLVIIFLLQAGTSFAQKYFVFIGSDNRQPFYVRVDSEFHSSSAEGHLILSQLIDSTYAIAIGFPGQTLPEQHYTFNMHGRDRAFELRLQDANGLRLYDLQDNEWLSLQGGGGAGDDPQSAGVKKDDAFSRMMAGVVHDTAVLYNTYAMEQALSDSPAVAAIQSTPPISVSVDTGALVAKSTRDSSMVAAASSSTPATVHDTAAAQPAVTGAPATATDSVGHGVHADTSAYRPAGMMTHQATPRFNDSGAAPLYRPITRDTAAGAAPIPGTVGAPLYRMSGGVVKLSERHSPKNVRLVYADHSAGKKGDTIVIIIPVDSPAVAKTGGRQPHVGDTSRVLSTQSHGPNADSPTVGAGTAYRPMPPTQPAEGPRPHPADTSRQRTKTIPFVNSDCHDFASDFDVDKLRVRMLETGRDDDRILLARKTFKSKCFSTRQIRTLSEVFSSDAAKFRFFEAAWPFAADEHFHELSDLLADPVYNSKFKTMTHQQ